MQSRSAATLARWRRPPPRTPCCSPWAAASCLCLCSSRSAARRPQRPTLLLTARTVAIVLIAGKFRFYDKDFGMLPGTGLPRLVRSAGEGGGGRHVSTEVVQSPLCCPASNPSSCFPPSFPRLPQIDMGQCNDAYSAIVVASKLAEAGAAAGHSAPAGPALTAAAGPAGWLAADAPPVRLARMHSAA